jgi:hypothetical protein
MTEINAAQRYAVSAFRHNHSKEDEVPTLPTLTVVAPFLCAALSNGTAQSADPGKTAERRQGRGETPATAAVVHLSSLTKMATE